MTRAVVSLSKRMARGPFALWTSSGDLHDMSGSSITGTS